MTIDRTKYKGTPVESLKNQEAEAAKITGKGNFTRAGYHKIEDGINKFRLYPAREGERSFIYLKSVTFLPQQVEFTEKDSNKTTVEVKMKPIFNSKVHANTPKDLVEEYITFSKKKIVENIQDSKEQEKRISILQGYKDSGGTWHSGITYSNKWVCYADRISVNKEFALLEVTSGVKEEMNKIAAIESVDEAIVTDPFTDVDEGICILIDYNSKAKKSTDYYNVTLDEVKEGRFNKRLVPTPLSDEDIEKWLSYDSLEKLFVNSYKYSDFEKALTGLKIFDEKNKIGTFNYDEWFNIVDEIEAYYTKEDIQKEEIAHEVDTELEQREVKKVEATAFTPNTFPKQKDELDLLDRQDLKLYIKEHQLPINIKPTYSDEQVRTLIRDVLEEIQESEKQTEEKVIEVTPQQVNRESFPAVPPTNRPTTEEGSEDRMAKLRERFSK